MAKTADRTKKKGGAGRVFVWIILVLLIAGLAGFGANGLGGSIASIGNVGSTEIPVVDYQRAIQNRIAVESQRRGAPYTVQQMRADRVEQEIAADLAAVAALSEETKESGLSVGDAEVARQLRQVPAFQGPDGNLNRDAYEFALRQNNTRASDFEDQLRLGASRELLQQAVTGGLTVSETYARTLYGFLGEQRSFRWASIDASQLPEPVAAPTDADLQSYYEDNSDQFLTDEVKKITYAWLTPDMLLETIEVDEEELRRLYEERSDQYNQPARRLVERLGFPDFEAATAAKAAIDAGETTFEALVQERGLTLEDVDQGAVARDDIDTAIADVIFAMDDTGVSEPINTSLGPVLYRVNAVLVATTTQFEQAREELLAETASDRASRIILDNFDVYDDLLVGGASLEELAEETEMQLATIDFSTGSNEDIAAYEEFRTEVAQLGEGDFPELRELSDGGVFAMRLDEVVAPTLPPLADIRDAVLEAYTADATALALAELGASYEEQVKSGTRMATLDLAAQAEIDLTRSAFVEGAPLGMMTRIFELEEDGVAFFQGPNGASALVEITDISPPDFEDEQAQVVITQLNAVATETLAADIFEVFGQSVQTRHGIEINQTAINAVLSQFGAGGGHGGL